MNQQREAEFAFATLGRTPVFLAPNPDLWADSLSNIERQQNPVGPELAVKFDAFRQELAGEAQGPLRDRYQAPAPLGFGSISWRACDGFVCLLEIV